MLKLLKQIRATLRDFCAEDDRADARRMVLALAGDAGVSFPRARRCAAWMYDAGRRFAGFDRSELQNEFARLRESMSGLESEAARLRSIANASESRLKIEQTAQIQLAAQVKALEDENNRLKEDLAFFENLVPAERRGEKVSIHRFKVERDVLPGSFAIGCSCFREEGSTASSTGPCSLWWKCNKRAEMLQ